MHTCAVDFIASHHIALVWCRRRFFIFFASLFLSRVIRFFFCSLSFARHNFPLKFRIPAIYININRLYGELKNRCVVRFCEKFEKRIIEMSRWKKSILHALMFFREGEKVNMFFNTNTLINNCHSGSMHTKTLSTNNNDCLSIWR